MNDEQKKTRVAVVKLQATLQGAQNVMHCVSNLAVWSWANDGRQTREIDDCMQNIRNLQQKNLFMMEFSTTPWADIVKTYDEKSGEKSVKSLLIALKNIPQVFDDPTEKLATAVQRLTRRHQAGVLMA